MKTIKKYWAVIVGAALALLAIFAMASNKNDKRKIKKIDDKIDDNNQKIDQLQGKTEVIEEQRVEVKQEIQETKTEIAELETAKEELKVTELPVEEAKQNILNKTRRGRKSKN
jgi:septal ring factor EnvC (AmiA/AmiB activator)